jgi:hypothetical protein
MADIPTTEPSYVTAGDTVAWTKSLSDYPATASWVLKYRLINASAKIDITATASGADHAVSVAKSTTAAWAAGWYDWQAYVEKAAERYTVGTGRLEIRPDLADVTASGFDNRSTARQIYDTLVAAYKSAVTSRAFVQEYEIAGRRMKFNNRAEWITEIDYWRSQVTAEEQAARLAAGMAAGNKLLVRFNNG